MQAQITMSLPSGQNEAFPDRRPRPGTVRTAQAVEEPDVQYVFFSSIFDRLASLCKIGRPKFDARTRPFAEYLLVVHDCPCSPYLAMISRQCACRFGYCFIPRKLLERLPPLGPEPLAPYESGRMDTSRQLVLVGVGS